MDKTQMRQVSDEVIREVIKNVLPTICQEIRQQIFADREEVLDFFKLMEKKLSPQSQYVALDLIAHFAPKDFVVKYVTDRILRETNPINKESI